MRHTTGADRIFNFFTCMKTGAACGGEFGKEELRPHEIHASRGPPRTKEFISRDTRIVVRQLSSRHEEKVIALLADHDPKIVNHKAIVNGDRRVSFHAIIITPLRLEENRSNMGSRINSSYDQVLN